MTMLMRPQQKNVKEILMSTLRKSMTLRMSNMRLLEDATEIRKHDDGSTSPRRLPKSHPRHSPDNYDIKCVSGEPRTKNREPIKMIHFAMEGELAPTEERGEEPHIRFEEVWNTDEIHHHVHVRQDGRADDVRDDAHAGSHDNQDRDKLFEDMTKVPAPTDGSTSPKRSPKPNHKSSPDDYVQCGEQVKDKEQEGHKKVKILIKMIPFAMEGEEGA
jgi:hypothetical protein